MFREYWKDIPGYEGLYQVSNTGKVKSLNYRCTGKEKIISQRIRGKGYLAVTLCKNKIVKHYFVHRLVSTAFLPNPYNLPQVNHKDENKQNNFVWVNEDGSVDFEKSNLEWCTDEYNKNYGTLPDRRKGRTCVGRGRKSGCGSWSKKIYQYTPGGDFIKEWNSSKEIQSELGFYHKSISKCCLGVYKQSHGYKWSYTKLESA